MKKTFSVHLTEQVQKLINHIEELKVVEASWKKEGLSDTQRLFLAEAYANALRHAYGDSFYRAEISDLFHGLHTTISNITDLVKDNPIFTKGSVFILENRYFHVLSALKNQVSTTSAISEVRFGFNAESLEFWETSFSSGFSYKKSIHGLSLFDMSLIKIPTEEQIKEIKAMLKIQRRLNKKSVALQQAIKKATHINNLYTIEDFYEK